MTPADLRSVGRETEVCCRVSWKLWGYSSQRIGMANADNRTATKHRKPRRKQPSKREKIGESIVCIQHPANRIFRKREKRDNKHGHTHTCAQEEPGSRLEGTEKGNRLAPEDTRCGDTSDRRQGGPRAWVPEADKPGTQKPPGPGQRAAALGAGGDGTVPSES